MSKEILWLLFLILACSTDPVVIQPETLGDYYAFCTLSPGYEYQEVLVGKAIPESKWLDIDDALVSIKDIESDNIVYFTHIINGVYRDIDRKLEILNSHSYYLKVLFSNGHVITGTTFAPDDFTILAPVPNDTIEYFMGIKLDTLKMAKVKWTKAEGAKFYSVFLQINDDMFNSVPVYTFQSQVYLPEIIPRFDWSSVIKDTVLVKSVLMVSAYDSTQSFNASRRAFIDGFVDFTEEQWHESINSTSQRNNIQSKIKGGIGDFKVALMASNEIVIKIFIDWP